MAARIIRTFPLEGKPVRIVAVDGWREDEEYVDDAEAQEVLQVTWGDYEDPTRGWLADIVLYHEGWEVSDGEFYGTIDEAATAATLQWVAYEKTLTPADYRRLFDKYTETLKNTARKANPSSASALARKLKF